MDVHIRSILGHTHAGVPPRGGLIRLQAMPRVGLHLKCHTSTAEHQGAGPLHEGAAAKKMGFGVVRSLQATGGVGCRPTTTITSHVPEEKGFNS